jgi:hypothetical protein
MNRIKSRLQQDTLLTFDASISLKYHTELLKWEILVVSTALMTAYGLIVFQQVQYLDDWCVQRIFCKKPVHSYMCCAVWWSRRSFIACGCRSTAQGC